MLEVRRAALRDHLLRSVGREPDYASARIRRPEGAVGFRQDAFGSLQVLSDVLDRIPVDLEVKNRIAPQAVGSIARLWCGQSGPRVKADRRDTTDGGS